MRIHHTRRHPARFPVADVEVEGVGALGVATVEEVGHVELVLGGFGDRFGRSEGEVFVGPAEGLAGCDELGEGAGDAGLGDGFELRPDEDGRAEGQRDKAEGNETSFHRWEMADGRWQRGGRRVAPGYW